MLSKPNKTLSTSNDLTQENYFCGKDLVGTPDVVIVIGITKVSTVIRCTSSNEGKSDHVEKGVLGVGRGILLENVP